MEELGRERTSMMRAVFGSPAEMPARANSKQPEPSTESGIKLPVIIPLCVANMRDIYEASV
jgi:hypothetical protein